MTFLTYLQIGDVFSTWIKSLYEIFSMNYQDVYNFLFDGATIELTGILEQYGVGTISLSVPKIPIINDIFGGAFSLLFFDTHFAHMPFYYSFVVSLTRITFTVLIIDIVKKLWTALPFT